MKIIVAGYCKTGTKSIHVALKDLGYNVIYDIPDHFWNHRKEWLKILSPGNGGSIDDFKKMYMDVDVVCDLPALAFWEEIHQAFPDSKIILMTRDEESFYKSFKKQVDEVKENKLFNFIKLLSLTGWRLSDFYERCVPLIFLSTKSHQFDFKFINNEMLVKKAFRQHTAYCMQNAPKDKLLVFNIKEGWEPLCKFLGKDVPDKPFPRENVAASLIAKLMETHPVLQRIKQEALCALTVCAGVGAWGIVKLYQSEYIPWLLSNAFN